jgi:hypothetical protein
LRADCPNKPRYVLPHKISPRRCDHRQAEGLEKLAEAKRLAQEKVRECDANITVVFDLVATGSEVASISHDAMLWDNE